MAGVFGSNGKHTNPKEHCLLFMHFWKNTLHFIEPSPWVFLHTDLPAWYSVCVERMPGSECLGDVWDEEKINKLYVTLVFTSTID